MKKRIIYGFTIFVVMAAALLAIFPVLYIVANSFMSGSEIIDRYTNQITGSNFKDFIANGLHYVRFGLIPDSFTLKQYARLLTEYPEYFRMFWNSMILVVPILIGQCLIAPLTAFAFEEMRWKQKEVIYFNLSDCHAYADADFTRA